MPDISWIFAYKTYAELGAHHQRWDAAWCVLAIIISWGIVSWSFGSRRKEDSWAPVAWRRWLRRILVAIGGMGAVTMILVLRSDAGSGDKIGRGYYGAITSQGEWFDYRCAAVLTYVVFAATFVFLMYIRRFVVMRSPPGFSGHCEKCRYDLRASEARCPECGTPFSRQPPTLSAKPRFRNGLWTWMFFGSLFLILVAGCLAQGRIEEMHHM
jgi:hypothetical protein